MILVSHNELVAVTSKAFSGLRLPYGEADLIANMVADLEMVGLHGIKHFIDGLTYLNNTKVQPCNITYESDSEININLNNESILCHLPTILGYISDKLLVNNNVKLNIENCCNRWLAFGELCKLSKEGISINACWNDFIEPIRIKYLLNSGNELPEIYINKLVGSEEGGACIGRRKLTIEFSNDMFVLPISSEYQQHFSSAQLKKYQEESWAKGISIKIVDWEKLKASSQAILVPCKK
jgi:hypothetical protein